MTCRLNQHSLQWAQQIVDKGCPSLNGKFILHLPPHVRQLQGNNQMLIGGRQQFCRGSSAAPLWEDLQRRVSAAEQAASAGVQSVLCAMSALLLLGVSLQQHRILLKLCICAMISVIAIAPSHVLAAGAQVTKQCRMIARMLTPVVVLDPVRHYTYLRSCNAPEM